MGELSQIELMKTICTALDKLIRISEKQQILLGTGKLGELPETFEERQNLFNELTLFDQKLCEMNKSIHPPGMDSEVHTLWQQIAMMKEKFLDYDTRVSILLTHHLEKVGYTLLMRLRAREVIKDYKEAEKSTNLIARLFEGNTRHMDVKK